jgi:hypothetical protein
MCHENHVCIIVMYVSYANVPFQNPTIPCDTYPRPYNPFVHNSAVASDNMIDSGYISALITGAETVDLHILI